MSHSFELIDRATGEVIFTQIHLWPNDCGECNMCGQERVLDHAVAWYCGPTHDEIGSISTECRSTDGQPAIVGGMSVCKECHDRHYYLVTHSSNR
jgi:hypothetical protein